jgi:hypothetical protein
MPFVRLIEEGALSSLASSFLVVEMGVIANRLTTNITLYCVAFDAYNLITALCFHEWIAACKTVSIGSLAGGE